MGRNTSRLAGPLAAFSVLAATAGPTYAAADPGPEEDLLRLRFDRLDDSGVPLLDAVGAPDLVGTVSSVPGGSITAGPDRNPAGHSLRMEPFRYGEAARPAVVVLRSGPGAHDRTDPGHDDFAFGADFVLDAETGVSPTDNGNNLVQRGLAGRGPQYKIQLDGGRPSCRVSGSEGTVVVRAPDAVDPGQWYRVRCRRVGDVVALRVVSSLDSVWQVQAYAVHGRTGTLAYGGNAAPFSIGGKVDADGAVLADDSDQFNGLIDNVVYRSLS